MPLKHCLRQLFEQPDTASLSQPAQFWGRTSCLAEGEASDQETCCGNSHYYYYLQPLSIKHFTFKCSFHYLYHSIIAHDSSTQPIFHLILQIPKVSCDEADTYKCYASNEYGKAVCTVVLNIIEGRAHTS